MNRMKIIEKWEEYEMGQVLSYEQPTPYIVESTDYDDKYDTPVLTAGKSFIIGYTNESHGVYTKLPVIIFDDFTTSTQYVSFPFKVKSSAMKILSANETLVLPKFMYYRMQAIQFDYSTHKRYWIQQYSKIKVMIPSIAEQHSIVSSIEELFSELDKAVETLQTTKQQLAVYRQAVLKEAFDSAGISEKNGLGAQQLSVKEMVNTRRLGMRTGPFGTMLKKQEHQKSGIPVLGIENIGEGSYLPGNKIFVSPKKAKELRSFKLQCGDVIISRSGTVGKICVVPKSMDNALMSTNLMRISLNPEVVLADYFVYLFRSKNIIVDQLKELCKGSTRIFLNQSILKQLLFPVPRLEQQEIIMQKIESRLSICDSIEQTMITAIYKANALRQSILKHAFEGRLKNMPLHLLQECIKTWRLEELDQLIIDFNDYIAEAVDRERIEFSKRYTNIILNSLGKSLLCVREILSLAAAGYPDGALSLSRNLYEQLITLTFFEHQKQRENFNYFVEDYYLDYEITSLKELISAHEWIGDELDISGMRSELEELKKSAHNKVSGDYWWAGKTNFTELVRFVLSKKKYDDNGIKIDDETDDLMHKFLGSLHAAYKHACISLHASCLGNIIRLKDDAEPHIVDILPTNDRQDFPLWFATSSLIPIFGLTCETLGINHEPFVSKLNEFALFYQTTNDRSNKND